MDDKQRAAMNAANPYMHWGDTDNNHACIENGMNESFNEGYTAAMHAHDAEKLALAKAFLFSDKSSNSRNIKAETIAKRIIAEAKENTDGR